MVGGAAGLAMRSAASSRNGVLPAACLCNRLTLVKKKTPSIYGSSLVLVCNAELDWLFIHHVVLSEEVARCITHRGPDALYNLR